MSRASEGGAGSGPSDAVERFLADPMGQFRAQTGSPKPQPVGSGLRLVARRRAQARRRGALDGDPPAAVVAVTRHAITLYAAGTQGSFESTARAALDVVEAADERGRVARERGDSAVWLHDDLAETFDDRLTRGRAVPRAELTLREEGIYREARRLVATIDAARDRDEGRGGEAAGRAR